MFIKFWFDVQMSWGRWNIGETRRRMVSLYIMKTVTFILDSYRDELFL